MSNVEVDTEKLAHGLEKGIGHTDTYFSRIPRKYRLRATPCGLVSTAVNEYLRQADIPSELIISKPQLPYDPNMEHVFVVAGNIYEDDPVAIDASYSQFLGHVGLHWGYEKYSGTREFPREKIFVFKMSERDSATSWLTKQAIRFQQANTHPKNEFDMDMGAGPLESASKETTCSNYSRIWNPANSYLWEPPSHVVEDGKTVSRYIPEGAIAVS